MRRTAALPALDLVLLAGCGAPTTRSATYATGNGKTGTTVIVNTPATSGGGPERVFRVPSGSMEPTFVVGGHVTAKIGAAPAVGLAVILHPPVGAEQEECGPNPHAVRIGGAACEQPIPHEDTGTHFIKRVVAGPGDSIYIREGHLYRKPAGSSTFLKASEPYVKACGSSPECDFPTPITIPAGDWFLLGDNRGESDDSRFWGPVPTAWIVGVITSSQQPPSLITEGE